MDRAKLTGDGAEVRQLQRVIEQQAEQLDKLARAKWAIPRAPRRTASGAFVRVVVPDTHGVQADPAAVGAFLGDLRQLGTAVVREVVMLGDHLDCGGFLAQHHTEHYVAQVETAFPDDVNATNVLLDAIQGAQPKATIDYLEGNHERRLEAWCVTQGLRNARNAAWLRRLIA